VMIFLEKNRSSSGCLIVRKKGCLIVRKKGDGLGAGVGGGSSSRKQYESKLGVMNRSSMNSWFELVIV
jgi:preprotein translocase subunit SecG